MADAPAEEEWKPLVEVEHKWDEDMNELFVQIGEDLLGSTTQLLAFQKTIVSHLYNGYCPCVNVGSGQGKSIPIAAFCLLMQERGEIGKDYISVTVGPLRDLDAQFVKAFRKMGLTAARFNDPDDPGANKRIRAGEVNYVFMSPEDAVDNIDMFRSAVYQEKLILMTLDEADQLKHWGADKTEEEDVVTPTAMVSAAGVNGVQDPADMAAQKRKLKRQKRKGMAFRPMFKELQKVIGALPEQCRVQAMSGTWRTSTRLEVAESFLRASKVKHVFVPLDRVELTTYVEYCGHFPDMDWLATLARAHSDTAPCPIIIINCAGISGANMMFDTLKDKIYPDGVERSPSYPALAVIIAKFSARTRPHTRTLTRTQTRTAAYTYRHTHAHTRTHTRTHAHITHTHTRTHIRARTYARAHKHIHTHTHTHPRAHTHNHIQTHTNSHTLLSCVLCRSYLKSIIGNYTSGASTEVMKYYRDELATGADSRIRILVITDKLGRGFNPKQVDGVIMWQPGSNIERVLQAFYRTARRGMVGSNFWAVLFWNHAGLRHVDKALKRLIQDSGRTCVRLLCYSSL
jgi:hypothetical protein